MEPVVAPRKRLAAELAQVERRLRGGAAGDDVAPSADEADRAAHGVERETDAEIRGNLIGRAVTLRAALARIDAGSYGRCDDCAEPIGAGRLRALPDAARCLPCQRTLEVSRQENS